MPSLLTTFAKKIASWFESFGGLVDIARNPKGILGFGMGLVLAGALLITWLFSEGSATGILAKLEQLNAEQILFLIVLIILCGVVVTLVVIVTAAILEHDRVRAGAAQDDPGATSGDGAPASRPAAQTAGLTAGSIPLGTRTADPFSLPDAGKNLGILPTPELPKSALRRIFLSYAQRDHLLACKLAAELRGAGYHVWHVEEGAPYTRLTLEVEQAIRSSEIVISLVTNTFFDSLILRGEVEFARDAGKAVIPVLVETPDEALRQRLAVDGMLTLYREWEAEIGRVLDRVRRECASRGTAADDAAPPERPAPAPLPAPEGQAPVFPQSGNGRARTARPLPQAVPPETAPFIYTGAVTPDWMVGRRAELATIQGRMGLTLGAISIVAERRMGKTSLLTYITERADQFFPGQTAPVVVYLNMQDARTKNVVQVMRLLRRRIQRQIGRDLWPEEADGDLAALADAFEMLGEEGPRLILCMDEWESVMAFPELNDLVEQLRASGSRSEIGMIVATAHDLSDLSRPGEVTSPFYNIFETLYLGLMPRAEWMELVSQAYARGGRQVLDAELDLIGTLAGGHPCLTQMAGSVVWQARANRWNRAEIESRYLQLAGSTLRSLWVRQSGRHQAAIRAALGIHDASKAAPPAVWQDLTRRGILTPEGKVFCQPFADFVMAEEL